jgi:hypothetical protein
MAVSPFHFRKEEEADAIVRDLHSKNYEMAMSSMKGFGFCRATRRQLNRSILVFDASTSSSAEVNMTGVYRR